MASDARTDFEALTREQVERARSDEAFQQRIAAAQDRFRPLLEALGRGESE